jgi:NAD(P)-dependent dehydrogenase (short-subunit alcohol dehydrogenase family)
MRVIELATALDTNTDVIADNLNRKGPFELRLGADAAWYLPVLRETHSCAPAAPAAAPAVVLITGGARGIMALIAKTLYRKTRCNLVLVGRTPPADATDLREVSRQSREVSQTLASLRDSGAQVAYLVADLTSESEVTRVREHVIGQFGRLDWIVHGAGVDSSAPLSSKSENQIEGVLATKLTALQLLSTATSSSPPLSPRWMGISSVAARFGNAGQVEYAAANEALARILLSHGGLVVDSGPWRDVGMAASLTHLLRHRNIDTLPSHAAAEAIAELIAAGATGEHVIAGRLGRPEVPLAGMTAHRDQDIPEASAFQTLRLDYEQFAWLRDHTLHDAALLPAVVSLALMSEVAQSIQPGTRGLRIESFVLRKAIIIRRGRVGILEVRAQRGPCIEAGVLVQVGIHQGSQAAHSAKIVLGSGAAAHSIRLQLEDTPRRQLGRKIIYAAAFHGETFRVLDTVELSASLARGRSVPLQPPLGADLCESIRYVAMAREVALQTVGVWLGAECEEIALPESLERLCVFAQPRAGEVVTATAQAISPDTGERFFNVLLTGEGDRVLEQIEGLRFRRTRSSSLRENAAVFAAALETEADEALM